MNDILIGTIDERVVSVLKLNMKIGTKIIIGESNIQHIKNKHKNDFEKYFNMLENIIKFPDYVGKRGDDSLFYIKEIYVDKCFVKVAIRLSTHGKCYIRTLFKIKKQKLDSYLNSGTIFRY